MPKILPEHLYSYLLALLYANFLLYKQKLVKKTTDFNVLNNALKNTDTGLTLNLGQFTAIGLVNIPWLREEMILSN